MKTFPKKTTAVFFSPTGGTIGAIQILAQELSQETSYLDLTVKDNRKSEVHFSNTDFVIVGCPVYGGQIPSVENGLFSNLKGDHTPCILLAAYGNRHYDNALAQMSKLLSQQGFVCMGAIACIIPHIFSNQLGADRPDDIDQRKIKDFADNIKKKLVSDHIDPVSVPGNPNPDPVTPKPMKKTWNSKLCNNCHTCVHICPVGAIDADTMDCSDSLCLNCMKCTKVCEQNARDFEAAHVALYLESNFLKRRDIEYFC